MKNTTTLALAVAAALACGTSAWAQGSYPSYPDDRYQAPYEQSYSASSRQLLMSAHAMDDAASYIRREFDRHNRRPNRHETEVSARLDDLAESARHFHLEVASYGDDPLHKQEDFKRLVWAYDRAADALRYVSYRPYVDQGMERIAARIDETAAIYGLDTAEVSHYRGENR